MNKMSVPSAVAVSASFLIASILVSVAVFGGVPVGPVTPQETPMVEAWIAWSNLDPNGIDPITLHERTPPEFQSYHERLDYIRSNNRDRPWLNIPQMWLENLSQSEIASLEEWIEINDLNRFADPKDTVYTGSNPLFDEFTGKQIPLDEYILNKHPNRPWIWSDIIPLPNHKEGINE